MSRPFPPSLLSANDLLSGRVIYLDHAGNWRPTRQSAAIFTSEAAARSRLSWAESQLAIVGPFLVALDADQLRAPRDRIREAGPFSLPVPPPVSPPVSPPAPAQKDLIHV